MAQEVVIGIVAERDMSLNIFLKLKQNYITPCLARITILLVLYHSA
jgi:hypothetical protein